MTEGERAAKTGSRQKFLVLGVFMLIMIGLGISDSNRGVFSGIFERDLALTKPQVSMIVTVSYVGNLLFMLFGSRAADKMDKKKACMGILGLWVLAQALFFCTDNYICLLIGMFISMGASTLMNTMMNILSPYFFGVMAGLYVNVLFFVQGIGTSGNQKLTGTLAGSYGDYRLVCGGLGILGLVCLVILGFVRFEGQAGRKESAGKEFPKRETSEKELAKKEAPNNDAVEENVIGSKAIEVEAHVNKVVSEKSVRINAVDPVSSESVGNKVVSKESDGNKGNMRGMGGAVIAMGLVFGFYFIAEHGIMNWWAMYCSQGLALDNSKASTSVSLFFGTMTLGRLVLAPLVQRLGSRRSIVILGGLGSAVYILGVLLGGNGVWLLGFSGIFISIVYPTIVLFLQELFPKEVITTATGAVISVGTLFDIGFNAVFGSLVEAAGFGVCRVIFPVAILIFYVGFLGMLRMRKKQF